MDRDTPRLSKGNDFESVDRLIVENPQDMCTSPIAIQAKTLPLVDASFSRIGCFFVLAKFKWLLMAYIIPSC